MGCIILICPSLLACVPTHQPCPLPVGHPCHCRGHSCSASVAVLVHGAPARSLQKLSSGPTWRLSIIPFTLGSITLSTMRALWAAGSPSWDTYTPAALGWSVYLSQTSPPVLKLPEVRDCVSFTTTPVEPVLCRVGT